MKNTLEYQGYQGVVEFSAEDGVFFGKLFGLNDLVTFEGQSVKELEKAFHEAVDDYIETCKEAGKEPERAYKGSFNVRINPDIHRQAAFKAQLLHISLNEFVERAIENEVANESYAKEPATAYSVAKPKKEKSGIKNPAKNKKNQKH